MKRILFFIGFLAVASVGYSQVTLPFRADSIRFYKQGGSAEFILENSTRAVTGGVLTNLGNGRTAFVTPSGGGSTSLTSQQIAWGNPSNVITSSNSLVFTTTNRFGINTGGSPTATLHVLQQSIASVGSGAGTAASNPLTILGADGGATSSGAGGSAGNGDLTLGNGGTGTTAGGNGGNWIFAAGGAGAGATNGVSGFVEFKGGSAPVTGNSAGGNVYFSPGSGVGSGGAGTIYFGVTSSLTVRGNSVFGATTDDYANKVQITGGVRLFSHLNNADKDSALRTTPTGVVEQYRLTDFSWTVRTGFDSLIWDKSAHELQAKALNITINGGGPTKTITDSTILYDFTVTGGGSLTSTRIGFGDGSNLLTGDAAYTFNNTTKTQTQILSGDTIDISPSGVLYSPPSSRTNLPFIKVKPFNRGSDEVQFTAGVFKVQQWSGAFSPNIVSYWGFNITDAGGQLESGKPSHTLSMETNYKPDSSAGSRWNETYLQHTFDDGVSFRPFFNVINEPARTSVWSFAGNQFDWVDRFQNAFGGVAFDSTTRKGTFNISSTPYGGVGWQVQADSINNTVNLTATGGLSTSREVVMSGLRNFSFVTGNGGSVKANTDIWSTGNGAGFQFDERDATSNKWIMFGNANHMLFYSSTTGVTPVKFHHSAPVNSLVLESTGNLSLGVNLTQVASSYHNWGATSGSGGYGFRDNSGTMEFKNSGGSWAALGSGGGGGTVSGTGTQNYLTKWASGGANIENSRFFDDGTETHIYSKDHYLTDNGGDWYLAEFNSTSRSSQFRFMSTPNGGLGLAINIDSTLKTVSIGAVNNGTNSDANFEGFRNISLTPVTNGTVKIYSDVQSFTNASGFQFVSRDATGEAWVLFANANKAILYTPGATQPWKIHKSAPTDSWQLTSAGDELKVAGSYINWDATGGSGGYGFRDNAGTMEFKNSGGSWAAFGAGGGNPFADNTDIIKGSGDATKLLRFEIDGFTTATTRTVTVQNADHTLAGLQTAQTFTANQTITTTGAGLVISGGSTGLVSSGSSFGIESSSVSVPFLASNSATTAGAVTVGYFQRSGSYTGAANDADALLFALKNNAGTSKVVAEIHASITTATASSEDGAILIKLMKGGVTAATTTAFNADASMSIFNGTAPGASVTNATLLYSEDVAASSELKVRDEAGNITVLSPHNFTGILGGRSNPMAWAYYSERDGKYINVDMYKLAELVERLTGEKLIHTGEVARKPNLKNK